MRNEAALLCPSGNSEYGSETEVLRLAAQAMRMVAVAQALVTSQRYVDVQGLENHVGLICAKALDLPPSQTGFLKLELKKLAAALDGLTASLRVNAA